LRTLKVQRVCHFGALRAPWAASHRGGASRPASGADAPGARRRGLRRRGTRLRIVGAMKLLHTLRPYLRPYRGAILLGLLLVVIANAFATAAPKLLGLAIDAIGSADATRRTAPVYAGLVILFALGSGAARYGMRQLLN